MQLVCPAKRPRPAEEDNEIPTSDRVGGSYGHLSQLEPEQDDPQWSEDSLGLVGRSEPTEFGRWIQWTSVLMAGLLGGGF
eukprot:scaffold503_cov667-Pavlova_lutheri.AAC.5